MTRETRFKSPAFVMLLGLLIMMLSVGQVATAQTGTPETVTPAASPIATPEAAPGEAEIVDLMLADIDQLPPAPFTVRLLRITLQPGAITAMHRHHGPEIDLVETGTIIIRSQGDAPVTRASGDSEISTGDDVELLAGDMILFPAEVGMYFENTSDEPAVLLSAVIIPVGPDYVNERITWLEGEPNLEGVTYQKLGDGLVQEMDQQPASWIVKSVTMAPGVALPATDGVSMITPTDGNFSFKIDSGQVQVTRAESNMLQPNAVLGTSFSLGDADAAFFPNGSESVARPDEENPLTVIVMEIIPETRASGTAATLTFTAGDGTIAGAGPVSMIGQIVTTNIDNVNMRDEPSVNGNIVEQIAEGVELEVLDGPETADGYTWYEVRVNEEDGAEGWMVTDFLDGLVPVAPEATSDGDTSTTDSETSTTGEDEPFSVGSTIITNEEGVRLRPEANTGTEAISALPEGTELTVTGASVESDGYVWIAVETADGEAGYVVADFVEAAP